MRAETIKKALLSNGLNCTDEQAGKLSFLIDLTLDKNKSLNLTAVRDENDFLYKMILDSLLVLRNLGLNNAYILDVGTGGGFPGLPLAIMVPNCKFVLLDSTKKKINHVRDVVLKLGLQNVICVDGRAEDYVRENSAMFDVVVTRAVASLPILCELCSPALKVGGIMVAYKGEDTYVEINSATNAMHVLKLSVVTATQYLLPAATGYHYYVIIRKDGKTPSAYPRKYSLISKKPL
ncbi:MAG: 16S rRNA (guanine(527)-N(7))-methyltransferase RsmG [Coprobacillus sp.]|nr:16S rRNA (guanine(527)-N(7))-methyltransferase RsmG [Coprobacillus sp.]